MVHPYLRRRDGREEVTYVNEKIKRVLEPTLGIPIFQEQAIRLSMVAAGFTGGEADTLRRAMASWGKTGDFSKLEQKFLQGMKNNGYTNDYANQTFEHIKGFSGYGFPESHSASFAILCYVSSWLKCHHPAAFYCALLNSQPMGFYSPSQLIQDAQRHGIKIKPVDINKSTYENQLEKENTNEASTNHWGIRLGFIQVRHLNSEKAKNIARIRQTPFQDTADLTSRAALSPCDLQHLAAADALRPLLGNRHSAHWQTCATQPFSAFLHDSEKQQEQQLLIPAPNISDDIIYDYETLGLTLRAHPMRILRDFAPFNQCTRQIDLAKLSHGKFVRVAGLVTGRQRPGTAKGTLFLTLEDETGNINVVIWKSVQDTFRQTLLTSKLLLIKGSVEFSHHSHDATHPVIHVVAGELIDYTPRLTSDLKFNSRDFH